jgi:hypothetical protein
LITDYIKLTWQTSIFRRRGKNVWCLLFGVWCLGFHWRRFPNRCLKEVETENPIELQQAGWQMILDNFKKYMEDL